MKLLELLSSEDKWCQDDPAQDQNGECTNTTSTLACKWCLIGAIWCLDIPKEPVIDAIKELFPQRCKGLGGSLIIMFNDNILTTYEDVKSVLIWAGV